MNTKKKMQIVEEAKKVWLELDADAHKDEPENEVPVIYMDEDMDVDWHEEGDGSFWHNTKTIFNFKFSDAEEDEVEALVIDGIDDYLDREEILSRI